MSNDIVNQIKLHYERMPWCDVGCAFEAVFEGVKITVAKVSKDDTMVSISVTVYDDYRIHTEISVDDGLYRKIYDLLTYRHGYRQHIISSVLAEAIRKLPL